MCAVNTAVAHWITKHKFGHFNSVASMQVFRANKMYEMIHKYFMQLLPYEI